MDTVIIGITTFVTTESFNSGSVMIYSHFDSENEIVGSMLVFGGSGNIKRVYKVLNPSDTNPFDDYFLTQVKHTNFRSRLVGGDDRSSMTQVRFNALYIKNRKLMTFDE